MTTKLRYITVLLILQILSVPLLAQLALNDTDRQRDFKPEFRRLINRTKEPDGCGW
ncbi:MAG TPA: hypothetical protein PK951_16430 [Chitinophagaceae bacterium]|nr:hypothetical protein [Chitinophagaceae bacterium]